MPQMNHDNINDPDRLLDPDQLHADRARQPRQRRKPDEDTRGRRQESGKPTGNTLKESREPRQRKPLRQWGIVRFFTDSRLLAVVGVALMLAAVYITVAVIGFARSGSADASVATTMTVSTIADNNVAVENPAGPVGAKISHSMIVGGLGLGSLAIIVYLCLMGLSLMGFRRTRFWSTTFKTLLVAITASIILGLISLWMGWELNLGGYHGHYMNILIVKYLDWVGAILISVLLAVATFYVYINDLVAVANRYKALRRARRDKAEQQRLQREADRERVRQAMLDADSSDDGPARPSHEESTVEESEPRTLSMGFDDPFASTDSPESDDVFSTTAGDTPEIPTPSDELPMETPTVQTPPAPEATTESEPDKPEGPSLEVETNTIEAAAHHGVDEKFDPTAELSRYVMPGLDLLKDIPVKANSVDREEQEENKERITTTLNHYGISISHIHATVGPTVTLYEIIPAEGTRIAKIKRLEDDIAMSLSALGIRIIAPIPGKGTIGIEVPNKDPQTVSIRSILGSKKFQECKYELPMAMGATISNDVYIADLCKMPHLLVAGATGMGKSVGLNTIIASLLYKKHPAELKFVLVDPKMVEFSLYSVLERHYLAKLPDEEEAVVTSMDKVLATLNSLCVEMDQRYMLLRDANVRSILEYNQRFIEKRLNPEKGHRYLPYIVMIVDEFADLIMTAGKEVEKPIARIAQKARAVGMHMIIATQRPSTNVITGLIKANFPGRIAFRVSQMVDSKTILDRTGANQLIGRGDMLFSHNGSMDRVQCAFIDTPEVQAICDHIDRQAGFEHAYYLPEPQLDTEGGGPVGALTDRDPLFEEAAEIVVKTGLASTSSLQRRYSIGYNRAGKIMDQLEAAGIVGPAHGGKPRDVLIDVTQLEPLLRTLD